MNKKIKDLLKRNNIHIIFNNNLDHKGYYIQRIKHIVINNNLSEQEQEMIILHELGHAINGEDGCEIYNSTFSSHCKEEWNANSFMIKELAQEYASCTGCDVEDINFINFLQKNKLSYRCDEIKKIIKGIA